MTASPQRIPLRPDAGALARRNADALTRAVTAHLLAEHQHGFPADVLRHHWPDDKVAGLIVRAQTSPATTTSAAWSELVGSAQADFVSTLGPLSAGAQLLSRGIQLSFDGAGEIQVPGLLVSAGGASFVQEAAPIPAHAFALNVISLVPRKLGAIAAFTAQLFEHSTPTVEALVGTVLREVVALKLDAALLDANSGDASRPPGLRAGIAG